ncbi:MAG: FAD-dependent oxidoreductase [Chloroflexota bacterium]
MQPKYRIEQGRVWEEAREIPVAGEFDVLVAGGGPSGMGAAVGAARQGAKTLLIERNGFLGGVATATMMTTLNCPIENMSGFAHDFVSRLIEAGGAWPGATIPFDPEKWKDLAFDEMEKAGVDLLLYTWVTGAIVEDGKAKGVIVENKSGRQALLAKVIVDCTGDADVAVRAGAEHVKGRERDGKMRPMTVLFRMGGVDLPTLVEYARTHPDEFTTDPSFQILDLEGGIVRLSGFFKHVGEAGAKGELAKEITYMRFEGVNVAQGTVFVNTTRVYGVDGTNAWDLTKAELECRRQMRQLIPFIQKYIPGCQNAYVIDASSNIGVRETRRIRGSRVLTEEDIVAHKTYEDTVGKIWRFHAAGADWHSPDGGEGSPDNPTYRTAVTPLNWYEIPYRVFVPNGVEGILVAGRTLSQTQEADMWTRGMFVCLNTGQIAGTAGALAAAAGVTPREVQVPQLQANLFDQGLDLGSRAPMIQAIPRIEPQRARYQRQ